MPINLSYEIARTKLLVLEGSHPVRLGLVKADPDRSVFAEQCLHVLETIAHHRQPHGVLEAILVVSEGVPGVEG